MTLIENLNAIPRPELIGPRQRPNAYWSLSLDVECPWCDHYFDIVHQWSQYGEWPNGLEPIEHPREVEATCPECGSEFECETGY